LSNRLDAKARVVKLILMTWRALETVPRTLVVRGKPGYKEDDHG
jgi:hypothetical protein